MQADEQPHQRPVPGQAIPEVLQGKSDEHLMRQVKTQLDLVLWQGPEHEEKSLLVLRSVIPYRSFNIPVYGSLNHLLII